MRLRVIIVTTENVYCTAPWNGLTIREDGIVRTCCVGGIPLGNLNQSTIEEIEKSPVLKEIQDTAKNGKPHQQNCQMCIQGKSTLKNYYNHYYPVEDFSKLTLKVVDIRWSNLCNLKCMYCTPMFSSAWQAELADKTKTITVQTYQDNVTDWLLKKIDDLYELMLVGGEPLLMKQNYRLISNLPKKAALSIITNLSYDLKNLPCIKDLLTRPKENTKWNVSLENTDQQFNYVRNLASWEQIQDNLVFLNTHWPDNVSIGFVYSMFSAFDIKDTFKKLHQLGIKKFNLMPIINQDQMDLFNMPVPIKILAAEQLISAAEFHRNQIHPDDVEFYPIGGLDEILQSLRSDTSTPVSKKDFYLKIQWYNQHSKDKFEDLWPHVMELVNLHLE